MESYSPPTRITFICHAATCAQRRAAFPLDESLAEPEIAEVAALGWNTPRSQKVWTGPECRVQQTAAALNLSFAVKSELRDCNYGRWSGRELDKVQSEEPDKVAIWLTDPAAAPHGGESILKLVDRVGGWLREQGCAGHVIAVTHPAVIRAAIVYALETPLQSFWRIDIAPLSLTDLRLNGKMWALRSSSSMLRQSSGFPSEGTSDPEKL